jgi:hypothetical protein
LGHFSPYPPTLLFAPTLPHFQADPVRPLSLILLKKIYKHNKDDKAFLLVELRIAIGRDSYHCFTSDKGLITRIYRELKKLNSPKISEPIKK